MNDPNESFQQEEIGFKWVYPDGTTYFVTLGRYISEAEAWEVIDKYPERVGSSVVRRTITFSEWTDDPRLNRKEV